MLVPYEIYYTEFGKQMSEVKPNGRWKLVINHLGEAEMYIGTRFLFFFTSLVHERNIYFYEKEKVFINNCNRIK